MALWRRQDIARWSTPRQLRKAGLLAREGLILGAVHGRLLRHNGPEHVLCIASTQAGKTSSIVFPNLLTWRESVIVHDPKLEIWPATAGWRSTFSRTVHLVPTSSTSQCYNPLDAIRLRTDQEMRDAQLIAEMLTDPGQRGADRRSDTGEHFTALAAEAVGGLLLYGLYTQRARSLGALNALIVQRSFPTLLKAMRTYPHAGINRAAMVLTQTDGQQERSGIFSTLSRTLRLYTDPLVARATDTSQFRLADLRRRARPMSLYVGVPFGDQERLRPWTRLVLRQALDYCVSRTEGWRWRMLGLIDEVPGLHRLNLLHDGLNYFAGFGVRLLLVSPSLEALTAIYGVHNHFLESCKVKIAFGLEDTVTPEVFSKRLGTTEVKRRRRVGRGQWGTDTVQEPLLSPTALQQLPRDQALVIAGPVKVLARKTYYRENAVWTARSQLVCGPLK